MAGLFRRRRGFLVKLVLLVPVLYIISLFIFSKRSFPSADNEHPKGEEDRARPRAVVDAVNRGDNIPVVNQPHAVPNLVVPQPDKKPEENNAVPVNQNPDVARMAVNENRGGRDKEEPVAANPDPYDPNGPGENGQGITIDKEKLSEEEKKKFDDGWKKNAYNQYASDMMSLHRRLPDVRDK
ncbi:Polypeptide N-acetylgalactosaminyltransferase 5, partial [Bulinus truncatus]